MNRIAALACILALPAAASAQEISNPSTVAPPIGRYSHLAVVPAGSDMLYVAGQVGNAPDGSIAADAEAQYERALRNVVAILASQGASPHNIVKLNVFLVKPIAYERSAAIRAAVLGDAVPPSTLVYVVRLARPDLMVEVEAIAVRPKTRAQN
ncbi:MAG: RidA family protein [Pseudomonadota bacterium]|uniref:RidA family protein n=1 Tax=Sphingomonas sp. ERG5 TaxID=1381597 RepID=UPI00068B7373|nr:RidA family protein [Sphingomonas sp. ERG5]